MTLKTLGMGVVKFLKTKKKHKALDIKEGKKKKYIKRDPHEGVPSQSSDWPYWRGEE